MILRAGFRHRKKIPLFLLTRPALTQSSDCYFYRQNEKIKITIPDPSNFFARPELFLYPSAFLGGHFLFVFGSLKAAPFSIFRYRVTFLEKQTRILSFGGQVKRTMASVIVKTKALMSCAFAADLHFSQIA